MVKQNQTVEVNYYGVNGRSGEMFDESFSTGKSIAFNLGQVVPGFSKGLVGQRQGSRVLIAMPGSDGYDPSGGNPQAGIEIGDTLIFVVDLVGVQLAGPEGEKVTPKAGLPTVADKNGQPEITVPKTDPPAQLQVQPLIKGKGQEVGQNDTITFDYRWVRWSDGKLLEESYSSEPANAAARRSAARDGQGTDGPDRRQPGPAGDPARRRLPRRQPHAVGRPGRDPRHGRGPALHPGRLSARLASGEQRRGVPARCRCGEEVRRIGGQVATHAGQPHG